MNQLSFEESLRALIRDEVNASLALQTTVFAEAVVNELQRHKREREDAEELQHRELHDLQHELTELRQDLDIRALRLSKMEEELGIQLTFSF